MILRIRDFQGNDEIEVRLDTETCKIEVIAADGHMFSMSRDMAKVVSKSIQGLIDISKDGKYSHLRQDYAKR